jgi:hypothetical protein
MKTVLVELHLCDKDAADFRAGKLSLSVAASANRGSSYNVIPDSDAQTTDRFLEMCERTGAAEKVRRWANLRKRGGEEWSKTAEVTRRTVKALDLSSILTPPAETPECYECGNRVVGDEQCSQCGYPLHDGCAIYGHCRDCADEKGPDWHGGDSPPAETCATCHGRGSIIQMVEHPCGEKPCPTCGGADDA